MVLTSGESAYGTKHANMKEKREAMTTANSRITVKVKNPKSRDRQLEQATLQLREKATDCGILVVRVGYTTYNLSLSTKVAYGQTREVDLL